MKRVGLGLLLALPLSLAARAQDVPGIEICTVDKTWERRTSCLQSNVDFLVKTINKMKSDQDQKLDAMRRSNEAQAAAITALQKTVAELQGAKKPEAAKEPAPAAKDAPVAKDVAPVAKDAPAAKAK